jgi:hypothetical protein
MKDRKKENKKDERMIELRGERKANSGKGESKMFVQIAVKSSPADEGRAHMVWVRGRTLHVAVHQLHRHHADVYFNFT